MIPPSHHLSSSSVQCPLSTRSPRRAEVSPLHRCSSAGDDAASPVLAPLYAYGVRRSSCSSLLPLLRSLPVHPPLSATASDRFLLARLRLQLEHLNHEAFYAAKIRRLECDLARLPQQPVPVPSEDMTFDDFMRERLLKRLARWTVRLHQLQTDPVSYTVARRADLLDLLHTVEARQPSRAAPPPQRSPLLLLHLSLPRRSCRCVGGRRRRPSRSWCCPCWCWRRGGRCCRAARGSPQLTWGSGWTS